MLRKRYGQPRLSFRAVLIATIILALYYLAWAILLIDKAEAHGWYTGAKDPVTEWNCCDLDDCTDIPDTDVQRVDGPNPGYIYKPTGEFIPRARVQPSKSYSYARCEQHWNGDHKGVQYPIGSTRCFFEPSGF